MKELSLQDSEIRQINTYIKKHFGRDEPTPEQILEIARDRKSFLHSYFEWDDEEAARRFRLIQAKTLLKVVIIEEHGNKLPQYNYVKLQGTDSDHYFDSKRPSTSLYEAMLPTALRELKSIRERYKNLQELAPVLNAIDQIEKEVMYGEEKTS